MTYKYESETEEQFTNLPLIRNSDTGEFFIKEMILKGDDFCNMSITVSNAAGDNKLPYKSFSKLNYNNLLT